MLNYYVDPGSGFVFTQSTSFLWAIILGLIGSLFVFVKLFFNFFRRFLWIFFIILVAAIILGGIMTYKPRQMKKVIILGIDAMEPKITEQLMQEGRLPNFSYLKTIGSYSHLATTMPAESVVAWTSFATGLNPGSHGVFDFIMRNPQNYLPYLSFNEISTIKGKPQVHIRKKGKDFWDILSKHKIPCFIYFHPNTFPPDKLFGRMLSGMGVPDILGSVGKFSFYTTRVLSPEDKDSRGKIIPIEVKNNLIETVIFGPKITRGSSITESIIPLKITLRQNESNIFLEFQGSRILLKERNWSNWQKISFKIGIFKKVYGIVRFYLKSIRPEFELYMSPVNFDPQRPFFPISYPNNYSKKLARRIGLYYTQGMPYDTWALSEGRLDEKAFLEITDEILRENEEILKQGLKEFKNGVFFFYFETLDAIQHMFWRYLDKNHPLYEDNSDYRETIFKYYERIDRILGDIFKKVDKNTTSIILSDHGFSSFHKAINLNRWLLENGYLFLKPGINESKEFFEDVDWPKTKAYALGLGGGIYLNKIGREYYGIVDEAETHSLKNELIKKLKDLQDPQTGERVIENVYAKEDIFKGSYIDEAPDLFVGFNIGYRVSWQTALGGVPALLIDNNNSKWSGDHLNDLNLVPGVIFLNKKIKLENSSIIDIVPTILDLFDINKPNDMPGKILFKE